MKTADAASKVIVKFVPVRPNLGTLQAFLHWRTLGRVMASAMQDADVVQTNVEGWPLPLGRVGGPRARSLGKFIVVVGESAPWHHAVGLRRLKSWIFEYFAMREVQRADVGFFTQSAYRKRFTQRGKGGTQIARVVPATWVDESALLDPEQVVSRVRVRASGEPLRILFAARFVPMKGVAILLRALELLPSDVPIQVTAPGDGEMLHTIRKFSRNHSARMKVEKPLRYGQPFLEMVDRHDCLAVPALSDEQPRVIYDAFGRGIPVIASDTPGNRECISDGVSGWLFPVGDAQALSALMRSVASLQASDLVEKGLAGLHVAKFKTHRAMHAERQQVVFEALQARGRLRKIEGRA